MTSPRTQQFVAATIEQHDLLSSHLPHLLPENALEFRSITDLTRAVKDSGSHFFDKATLEAFGGQVQRDLVGGRFFITSEQAAPYYPDTVAHHVRWVSPASPGGPQLLNVGRFAEDFKTLNQARGFAEQARLMIPSGVDRRDGLVNGPTTQLNSPDRQTRQAANRVGATPVRPVGRHH